MLSIILLCCYITVCVVDVLVAFMYYTHNVWAAVSARFLSPASMRSQRVHWVHLHPQGGEKWGA